MYIIICLLTIIVTANNVVAQPDPLLCAANPNNLTLVETFIANNSLSTYYCTNCTFGNLLDLQGNTLLIGNQKNDTDGNALWVASFVRNQGTETWTPNEDYYNLNITAFPSDYVVRAMQFNSHQVFIIAGNESTYNSGQLYYGELTNGYIYIDGPLTELTHSGCVTGSFGAIDEDVFPGVFNDSIHAQIYSLDKGLHPRDQIVIARCQCLLATSRCWVGWYNDNNTWTEMTDPIELDQPTQQLSKADVRNDGQLVAISDLSINNTVKFYVFNCTTNNLQLQSYAFNSVMLNSLGTSIACRSNWRDMNLPQYKDVCIAIDTSNPTTLYVYENVTISSGLITPVYSLNLGFTSSGNVDAVTLKFVETKYMTRILLTKRFMLPPTYPVVYYEDPFGYFFIELLDFNSPTDIVHVYNSTLSLTDVYSTNVTSYYSISVDTTEFGTSAYAAISINGAGPSYYENDYQQVWLFCVDKYNYNCGSCGCDGDSATYPDIVYDTPCENNSTIEIPVPSIIDYSINETTSSVFTVTYNTGPYYEPMDVFCLASSASPTPSPSASASSSASASMSASTSMSSSASASASMSPSASASASMSPTSSMTPTPTVTPGLTPSATPCPPPAVPLNCPPFDSQCRNVTDTVTCEIEDHAFGTTCCTGGCNGFGECVSLQCNITDDTCLGMPCSEARARVFRALSALQNSIDINLNDYGIGGDTSLLDYQVTLLVDYMNQTLTVSEWIQYATVLIHKNQGPCYNESCDYWVNTLYPDLLEAYNILDNLIVETELIAPHAMDIDNIHCFPDNGFLFGLLMIEDLLEELDFIDNDMNDVVAPFRYCTFKQYASNKTISHSNEFHVTSKGSWFSHKIELTLNGSFSHKYPNITYQHSDHLLNVSHSITTRVYDNTRIPTGYGWFENSNIVTLINSTGSVLQDPTITNPTLSQRIINTGYGSPRCPRFYTRSIIIPDAYTTHPLVPLDTPPLYIISHSTLNRTSVIALPSGNTNPAYNSADFTISFLDVPTGFVLNNTCFLVSYERRDITGSYPSSINYITYLKNGGTCNIIGCQDWYLNPDLSKVYSLSQSLDQYGVCFGV